MSAVLALQQAVHSKSQDPLGMAKKAINTAGDEIRLALQMLQQDGISDKVAHTACGALRDLLLTDEDCRVALDANAVPILSETLLFHGASPAVMMDGMAVLQHLASSDRTQARLMRSDLLPMLMGAMRQHRSHPGVMALSLAVLVELCSVSKGRSSRFTRRVMEFTVDVMMTHPRDLTIQCRSCELIYLMAEGPTAQQRMLALGALETVVEAVRQFSQERDLLQRALPTLCQLCEADQGRIAIGQAGAVPSILYALNCNFKDPIIARYGCTLLTRLTLSIALEQQVVNMNVRTLVKKILNHHAPRCDADHTRPNCGGLPVAA
eukprot:GGOE01057276.1.p1 GENE.GGOE01057276.1~~GGOE01057276.1.p1  ORF type:complete len:335 (-),score=81.87 GGOE01057276.1:435-1400(-)